MDCTLVFHSVSTTQFTDAASQSRREKEALKIRDDLKLKWSQLESFAGRLERAAGQFGPSPTGKAKSLSTPS